MPDQQTTHTLREPPASVWGSVRFLGPGLILSAAVVGSGELIATTALGARAGFALLGIILFGCLIKVGVQLEFGRHSIVHGVPSFQAWNDGRGPRLFGLHWSTYTGLLYLVSILAGQAGVVGGAAQVAAYAVPGVSASVWAVVTAVVLSLLVFHGRYGPVEGIATALNALFVVMILYCMIAVQRTDYAVSAGDIASGFSFTFPAGTVGLAVAAFGITGVGAGEIFAYPYWCVEKGYGAWAGRSDGSPAWSARARGWIRVMTIDAVVSMVIYTVATVGFYILGAAILSRQEGIADGSALIRQLSGIITEVMGEGAMVVFMIGAFCVLFSTAFSNTAAHSRMWADFLGISRVFAPGDAAGRRRWIAILAWCLPAIWALVYVAVRKPLFLVALMGISNSLFLVVVAYQALVYRYRATDPGVRPSRGYDGLLWGSVLAIGFMACLCVHGVYKELAAEKPAPASEAVEVQERGGQR
jgi:Mn2+/Fe2+ NRAMP family transporter